MWNEKARREVGLLGAWAGVYLLFHLPLELTAKFDNPARFLLPAFPPLAVLIGYALSGSTPRQAVLSRRLGRLALVLFAFSFLYQKITTFPPSLDYSTESYGHLTADEREAYVALGNVLPENAILAVDEQQPGAIQMYTNRFTVRPWVWTPEQFERFLVEARTHNWPLFFLGSPAAVGKNDGRAALPSYLGVYRRQILDYYTFEPKLYRLQ